MNEDKINNKKSMDEGLEFEVMPQDLTDDSPRTTPSPDGYQEHLIADSSTSKNKIRVWVISIVTIIILFVIGFLSYKYYFEEKFNDFGRPKIVVPAGNTKDIDSDNDGLSDTKERELGTDPNDPDTDKDGLSDGDEINIYETDPLLEDTDLDTFLDGDEVARGFSPTVNTLDKVSEEERKKWLDAIVEHGLHEPTKKTISQNEPDDVEVDSATNYKNDTFKYTVVVPTSLEARESQDKSILGFYVKGTTPDDQNPGNDILTISVAIKPTDQSLEEWGNSFLVEGENYQNKTIINRQEFSGVNYTGISDDGSQCLKNQTHFAKPNESKVIAITLTCSDSIDFTQLFDEIVSSFNFSE